MRPSQNLPLSPRIYPPFQQIHMCDPFRIYPPPPSTIYPPFQQIYMCDPPRIYPSLPEYTPLFNKFTCATLLKSTPPPFHNILPFSTNLYVRPFQNLLLSPRIYPSFQQIYVCDPPRIYPSLPEYTPPFQQLYATLPESTPPSQNISTFSTTMCDPPRTYPSLPEYTPLFNNCINMVYWCIPYNHYNVIRHYFSLTFFF